MIDRAMTVDLVLSSGFLAFAAQAGFLAAVQDVGLDVDGLCGTSSGALAGALWAAGHDAHTVFDELTARSPLAWLTPHASIWRGAFRLDGVVEQLGEWLPPRFEDLERPLGVGVATADGGHAVITSGPLPEAVAASCAVPHLFVPITLEGRQVHDGGAVDRTALRAWRALRPDASLVLHRIERSAGTDADDGAVPLLAEVRSPRSGAQLWSLGDARGRFEATRHQAAATLSSWTS